MCKLLIDNNVALNNQDWNGRTGLHGAALNGHIQIVRLLLSHGADTNIQNDWGKTALMEAEREGHEEIVSELSNL